MKTYRAGSRPDEGPQSWEMNHMIGLMKAFRARGGGETLQTLKFCGAGVVVVMVGLQQS